MLRTVWPCRLHSRCIAAASSASRTGASGSITKRCRRCRRNAALDSSVVPISSSIKTTSGTTMGKSARMRSVSQRSAVDSDAVKSSIHTEVSTITYSGWRSANRASASENDSISSLV